jgi:hypothetical protein
MHVEWAGNIINNAIHVEWAGNIINNAIHVELKEILNNEGQQFHQYQQNKQSPLGS